jgi:UDP-N-acetylglucosamine--N-acetylmuramyl-(pentapeptide) pyrophosphoryl-undecaprenol N-acetylglucosamine transferase
VNTGNPVRWVGDCIPPADRSRSTSATLFIFGGSAGAHRLNQVLPQAVALLHKEQPQLRVIHQTGRADHAAVVALYKNMGLQAEVMEFIDDMRGVYAAADLVICRAGALTIAELTVLGKPSILVPYPYAADDHQRVNAEVLEQNGAARMILDAELTPERVSEEILALIMDRTRLEAMARAAAALGKPQATHAVVQECLACVTSSDKIEMEAVPR